VTNAESILNDFTQKVLVKFDEVRIGRLKYFFGCADRHA